MCVHRKIIHTENKIFERYNTVCMLKGAIERANDRQRERERKWESGTKISTHTHKTRIGLGTHTNI